MRISLRVPLSPYIGYGNDGIGIASALIEQGADVHIAPGNLVDSPLPPQVAELFTKEKLESYDIQLHHVDPDGFQNSRTWEHSPGLKVGWTMWEFSNFKNAAGYKTMRERLKPYDLFLAYDDVTAEALSEVYDGPIRVLQGGFIPDNFPYMERDWDDPDHFRFCMVGQLHERKDPFVAIQAFTELKHELGDKFAGAELHLKNSKPGALFDKMNEVYEPLKLRVYNDIWDHETLLMFYSQMHCLLAPSRGEGKNMPALEFQSTGGPVIATNWGGHTGWLSKEYSYPLDYTLKPMDAENPETYNARASVEHLKSLMLHLYENRAEAKHKGRIASGTVTVSHDWNNVISKMFGILAEYDPKIAALVAVSRIEASRGNN